MTTRTTRPTRLKIGAVSSSERRRDVALVLLLAAIWRVVPFLRLVRAAGESTTGEASLVPALYGAPPGDLLTFLASPDVSWVGSPLYLLAMVAERHLGSSGAVLLATQATLSWLLVLFVYRVGDRWLGHASGLVAAILCAVSAPILQVTLTWFPTLALAAGSLLYAAGLSRFASLRSGDGAFRLGLGAGILCWLGGSAVFWLFGTLLWLPQMSQHFRGRPGARIAGWILLGWIAAVSPIAVRGLIVQQDLVLPFSNGSFDVYQAATTRALVQTETGGFIVDPIERRGRSLERARELAPHTSGAEIPRAWTFTRFTLTDGWARPGEQLDALARRGLALVGSIADGPALDSASTPERFAKLALLPGEWVLAVAWLGLFALVSSLRRYLPLYLGLAIPAVVCASTGLTARVQMLGFPFLCLMAGYGIVRWWEGRRAWLTWVLAPLALAVGIVLVRKF